MFIWAAVPRLYFSNISLSAVPIFSYCAYGILSCLIEEVLLHFLPLILWVGWGLVCSPGLMVYLLLDSPYLGWHVSTCSPFLYSSRMFLLFGIRFICVHILSVIVIISPTLGFTIIFQFKSHQNWSSSSATSPPPFTWLLQCCISSTSSLHPSSTCVFYFSWSLEHPFCIATEHPISSGFSLWAILLPIDVQFLIHSRPYSSPHMRLFFLCLQGEMSFRTWTLISW